MFNDAYSHGNIDPVHSIPDHSLLTWIMEGCEIPTAINNVDHDDDNFSVSFTKYDTSDIPYNFMLGEESITAIDQALEKLEQLQFTQGNIDDIYGSFCDTVKMEMDEKLAKRKVTIKNGISNNRRGIKKTWWNDQLTELCNIKCDAERK